MKELNFSTGLVTYSLNGSAEVTFNPTDPSFGERLFNAFDDLDTMQTKYKERIEKIADKAEIFKIGREMDANMRERINGVFNADICTPVFGSMNTFALAEGMPAWANLLLVIMDELDTSYAREQKATNPRLQKYMNKYKKYGK